MIVAGSASPLLLSSAGGYNLTNSLRFRASASAWLNRTPASSGNLNLWTLSWWTKRGQLSTAAQTTMFGTDYASSQEFMLQFTANNRFVFEQYASGGATNLGNLISTQVFRDPSAWYHFVVTWDSTQATASNRIKIYVNGSQITAFDTASYPAQNASSVWNQSTNQHRIGQYSTAKYYDGYMGEVNFIDGQALTPSSFGQTSATTGVWIPKKYSGTYGTNGFYLPFTDNSALTTSSNVGLGKDFSGNANYWTTNNISITSGSTYDSMTDVPTLTSATAANYCVLNPLANGGTLSGGNLNATSGTNTIIYSTFALQTNKYYWEVTLTNSTTQQIGIADFSKTNTTNVAPGDAGKNGYIYLTNGSIYNNGSQLSSGLSTVTTNDVVGIAYDSATNKLWFNKNGGTWFGGGDPAAGTTPTVTTSSSFTYCPVLGAGGGSDAVNVAVNFGQRPFAYTPPTGFVALNTFNLPTPTIGATASTQAGKYMNPVLFTGNSSGASVTGVGFQPDFVWMKCRSTARNHELLNAVTGGSSTLFSNLTNAEATDQRISSFNSDGFTYTTNSNSANTGDTFVAWNWKANGSGSTNTAGSITSTVSANTTAGFSIVTYTGNGTNGATVGHGLGVAPRMIFVKDRSQGGTYRDWAVYNTDIGAGNSLYLNGTSGSFSKPSYWNSTATTSTVFTLGNDITVNQSGDNFVAYCFAQVAGYSAFGSYTGNGSSDGPFIYTGFRPKYVMIKASSIAGENWYVVDATRSPYNAAILYLSPNNSGAEASPGAAQFFDFVSNGFKLRVSGSYANSSGTTYIYMAFAESPFKYANAR